MATVEFRESRQALIAARDSRAATDGLLQVLHREGWGPFLLLTGQRSVHQARLRPWAVAELAAVHGVFARLAGRRGQGWVVVSGALALTHLGLLEERRHLSPADVLTLVRGNLPALAPGGGRWLGLAAIGLDFADGRLARRLGTASPFGAYADSFADATVWTWLALRHEPDPRWRAAALVAWSAPVVAVTAASLARGRMLDAPRPVVLRPAAAMQAALALRLLVSPRRGRGPR